MNEPSWFWQLFVSKNIIFHNFYVLFPDWYIHETIYYWILINLCLFSDWYIHETSTACNEELRHPGADSYLKMEHFEALLPLGVNFSSPLDFYTSNKKIHEMKISYTEGEVQQTFLKSRAGG